VNALENEMPFSWNDQSI